MQPKQYPTVTATIAAHPCGTPLYEACIPVRTPDGAPAAVRLALESLWCRFDLPEDPHALFEFSVAASLTDGTACVFGVGGLTTPQLLDTLARKMRRHRVSVLHAAGRA